MHGPHAAATLFHRGFRGDFDAVVAMYHDQGLVPLKMIGFESGVNKRIGEAPIFYGLYTFLIVVGAGVILIPNFPLVRMILLSQVINGVLLPFVLIYMTIIVNRKGIMRDWTNSRAYNAVAWTAVALMIGLTVALVGISLRDISG